MTPDDVWLLYPGKTCGHMDHDTRAMPAWPMAVMYLLGAALYATARRLAR